MFGSKKKKAIKAIHNNVLPVVSMYQQNYGLPSHFWMHEYVLGFFCGLMSNHAKMATNGSITGVDFDVALIEGWGIISGQNGQQIWKRSADFAIASDNTFFEGFDRANQIFFLSINRINSEGMAQGSVKSAFEEAGGDSIKASTILMLDTFSDMKERLA